MFIDLATNIACKNINHFHLVVAIVTSTIVTASILELSSATTN